MPGLAPKSMTRQKEEKNKNLFFSFFFLPPSSVCLTFHGCAPGVLAHSHPQLSPRVVRFPTKKEKQKTFVETTRPHIFGCAPDTLSRRLLSPTFEINRTHARKYKRQKISKGYSKVFKLSMLLVGSINPGRCSKSARVLCIYLRYG